MLDRQTLPILLAVLGNLLVTAIAAFLISFFPLLYRSIDVASNSADAFGNSIISNAYDQVSRALSTCARGFEGLDSAGIQNLYRLETPAVTKYWQLRARLAGDLMLWISFYEGSGVFVGRVVPCNASIPRTPNDTTVWVTEVDSAHQCYAELWHMEGINTSLIHGSRIGPIPTTFNATSSGWYRDYDNSIYAHWRYPEADTFQQFTTMRIGAQGGLNNSARYCVYVAEINSDAITTLLKAIKVTESGTLLVFHSSSKALLGANFAFDSIVLDAPTGAPRPRLYTEIAEQSPFMYGIVHEWQPIIEMCNDSCNLDAGVSFDKLFVRVRRITDSYGLDVRLVIAMRAIDFLNDIQSAKASSLAVTLPSLSAVVVVLSFVTWLTVRQAAHFLRKQPHGASRSNASGQVRSQSTGSGSITTATTTTTSGLEVPPVTSEQKKRM